MRFPIVLSCLIALSAFAAMGDPGADSSSGSESAPCCLLKRGRTVDVRFVESLRPRKASHGQQVRLEVANDLVVEGHLVLQEGAEVIGHVKEVKRRGAAGIPARLDVIIEFAEATNGELVPLVGAYSTQGADRHVEAAGIAVFWCICGLLIPGEDVLISEGTIVTCFVRDDTLIRVEGHPDAQTHPCEADSLAADSPDTSWSGVRSD